MTPTEAAEQIATVAATCAGLKGAHYPPPGRITKTPVLVLLWSDTTNEYMSTEQYWNFNVRGLLLGALANDTPYVVAEVDPLITPLVDLFDAGNLDGFLLKRPNGDICDGCQITSVQLGQEIAYAGHTYYGAVINWNVQLRRFA